MGFSRYYFILYRGVCCYIHDEFHVKRLEEVIESFGGICIKVNDKHVGKIDVLLHYDDFLLYIVDIQRSLFYDERKIYLLVQKDYLVN